MRSRTTARAVAATAIAATLTLGLVACGDDDDAVPVANSTEPVASLTNLDGKMTEVEVASSFLEGLSSLGLKPGTVGSATLTEGTLAFPITGGNATYYEPGTRDPYVESSIAHNGSGISLTDGKTKVKLTNFVIDAGASVLTGDVSANGKSVVTGAPLFFLDGRTLQPLQVDEAAGTGVLYGTTVSLTEAAADLLNQTYGTDALAEFFTVGTARITLKLA